MTTRELVDSCEKIKWKWPWRFEGSWIRDKKRFGDDELRCSVCGAILEGELAVSWRNNFYCYHCGARMLTEDT